MLLTEAVNESMLGPLLIVVWEERGGGVPH